MAKVFPLVLILLITLTFAAKDLPWKKKKMMNPNRIRDRDLPPAAKKRVMALRAKLRRILTDACKRLLWVVNEMVWSRRCLYNGLSYPRYKKYRAVCKNRSESLDALRNYRMRCKRYPSECSPRVFKRLFRERQRAVKACEKIGWNGRDRRKRRCLPLKPLKDEFERTKGACKGNIERVRKIRKEIREVKANFAKPSSAPVARYIA